MELEKIIIKHEKRLVLAQLNSDIDELSNLIDNNLVFSGLDGAVVGKEDDLNIHRMNDFKITKMELISREIHLHEKTAVVNTLMDACAEFGGNVQADKIRYIRVWHKSSNQWRVISGCMRQEAE
ncbi:MAG: nuclear transport factor 2 family protein [Pseudomonadales bacterium]|nr:nuclear transport factor 2 family protein [Pseudomonadales bacterium]